MTPDVKEADPVVWMFPGQGVQYFQMGRVLYDGNATFRGWMDRLDAVAASYAGQSIVGVLYEGAQTKSQAFDHLLHTHTALFMVQFALAKTLLAEGFPAPHALLGASLGEFVAAAVGGVAEPEAMLFDIIKQARLFEAHCGGGAMLLVLDDVETYRTSGDYAGRCELAGVNFDGCFVVSGTERAIADIATTLRQKDIVHQLLPVPVAFHSSHVDPMRELYERTFVGRGGGSTSVPVISCAPPTSADRFAPAYWWHVIRQPIEFQRTILDCGRDHPRAIYVDLGPSGNMATFAKYNLPQAAHERIVPVMTPFGRDLESIETARGKLAALRG
jgi:bacillaene synthase trans-acting acyltransferase